MKVDLINYTQDALELLIFTKNTRLTTNSPLTLADIKEWNIIEKKEHLEYMRDTIQSSWEFVDYVFQISEVSRAFTHQLVRTRTASYAQQSQRTVDVRDAGWVNPFEFDTPEASVFRHSVRESLSSYARLKDEFGAASGDARGVIPTNIHTSIIAKMNLRTLSNIAELRLCTRTQGEYQDVVRLVIEQVHIVHPWVKQNEFLEAYCVKHGICAFPRYKDCPFQHLTYHGDPEEHETRRVKIKHAFMSMRHEANPTVTKEAKTHG